MKKIFVLLLTTFVSSNAFAKYGLPKQGVIQISLDQPATRISFPSLDLSKIEKKSCTNNSCFVSWNQDVKIAFGGETYELSKLGEVFLKNTNSAIDMNSLKMIKYSLYSPTVDAVVGRLVIDIETGKLIVFGSSSFGKITDWY